MGKKVGVGKKTWRKMPCSNPFSWNACVTDVYWGNGCGSGESDHDCKRS